MRSTANLLKSKIARIPKALYSKTTIGEDIQSILIGSRGYKRVWGHSWKLRGNAFGKTIAMAGVLLFSSSMWMCAQPSNQQQQPLSQQQSQVILQQLSMSDLVHLLASPASLPYLVVIYQRAEKQQHPKQFAAELKSLLEQCQRVRVGKVYMISSRDQKQLEDIERRLKGQKKQKEGERRQEKQQGQQQKGGKKNKNNVAFRCYFRNSYYNQPFQLTNNTPQHPIEEQLRDLLHFQPKTNPSDLTVRLSQYLSPSSPQPHPQQSFSSLNSTKHPFPSPSTIIIKQCLKEGECVDSFKAQVRQLLEQGMLTGRRQYYEFAVVVDEPKGLLSKKPSEYVREFQGAVRQVIEEVKQSQNNKEGIVGKDSSKSNKGKSREETYLIRKDVLGREVRVWSEWLEKMNSSDHIPQGKQKANNANFEPRDPLLMFVKPRIHLITRGSLFNDLLWYLRTTHPSNCSTPVLTLSLNNTSKFKHLNSPRTLSLLNLIDRYYPELELMVIDADKAGDLISHVHADRKWVLFEKSQRAVWRKVFLGLDQLEGKQGEKQFEDMFKDYGKQIREFVEQPRVKDKVVVDKQMEIGIDKLKKMRDRQLANSNSKKQQKESFQSQDNQQRSNQDNKYVIRVCKGRCSSYLSKAKAQALQACLGYLPSVYWIDSTAQNVGREDGDYLLQEGKLTEF